MNKEKLKYSVILFLLLVIVTFTIFFKSNNFIDIYNNLKEINILCILISLGLIVFYFYLQGLFIKLLLKSMGEKITTIKSIFYAIVEFFFSAITPSSTGGQPVQLYYMSKDNIPVDKSIIVLILNTIMFKIFFLFFSIVILLFKREYLVDSSIVINILFWLGIIVDLVIINACLLLMYNQKIISKIFYYINKVIVVLTNKKIDYSEKFNDSLEKYMNEAKYIKENKKEIFISLIITFIQRMSLFSIIYVVYRSLGLREYNYFDLLLIQIFSAITIEGLPFPGGTGAIEHITNSLYFILFGSLAGTGMIINRTMTFYIPLLIIMVVIIITTQKYYKKKLEK